MSLASPADHNPLLAIAKRTWALSALIVAAFLIVIGALLLAGAQPGHTFVDLITQTLGSAGAISATLEEVTPLLISGIAVFLALKAGLFNIGVEGQFTVGALAAGVVALRIPGLVGVAFAIFAGIVAGGLWALPAAAIKAYRGGHEVITTIMLNQVAALITTALVAGPFKPANEQEPKTALLAEASYLPNIVKSGNLEVSSGLLIGAVTAIGLWLWLSRSVSGYELRAVGANQTAARFAGINHRLVILKAMVWSGAIGGLAGAVQVLSFQHDFVPGMSSGYGFDALGVALLAGATPLGLFLSSLLFGVLNRGGPMIQVLDQVPKGITSVILGLLIVIAAALRYRKSGVADR